MKQLLKNNLKNNLKQFIPLVVLAIVIVLKFSSISGGELRDNYFYFYEGMDLFEPGGSQIFELPYIWFLLHSYILFLVGRDCSDELNVLETKLLFEKGKFKFQIMKFVSLLLKVLFSMILFLGCIFIFKETIGRFIQNFEVINYFSEEYFPEELYKDVVLYKTIVCSVLGILIFGSLLQILSYFTDSKIAFLIINLIMITGLFTGKSFLLINGMMIRRYFYSLSTGVYLLLFVAICLIATLTIKFKEKHRDYLGVFRWLK